MAGHLFPAGPALEKVLLQDAGLGWVQVLHCADRWPQGPEMASHPKSLALAPEGGHLWQHCSGRSH